MVINLGQIGEGFMESLWQVAVSVAGLGAVGAFVFYSLYKEWLQLPALANLTRGQRYSLFKLFLLLTFGFAAISIAAWSYSRSLDTSRRDESARELEATLAYKHEQGLRELEKLRTVTSNKEAASSVIDAFSNKTKIARAALRRGDMVMAHEASKDVLSVFDGDDAATIMTKESRELFKVKNCDTRWDTERKSAKK